MVILTSRSALYELEVTTEEDEEEEEEEENIELIADADKEEDAAGN